MATIRIETRDHLRTLYIDDAESSAIDLADPTRLEFEYMQHIDVVTNHFFASPQPIRALHLGQQVVRWRGVLTLNAHAHAN